MTQSSKHGFCSGLEIGKHAEPFDLVADHCVNMLKVIMKGLKMVVSMIVIDGEKGIMTLRERGMGKTESVC